VIISKAPFNSFLPHFRASLVAPSLASAPELQKNTLSSAEFSTIVSANDNCGVVY
jgi:hypothetical protein